MPVSVSSSRLIYDALKACDVKIISALPETWLVHLIRMADEDPDMTLVRIAKEEEAIGISAGAHLAGRCRKMRLRYRRPDAPRSCTTPEMDLDRTPGAVGSAQERRGRADRRLRRHLTNLGAEAQDHRSDHHGRDVPGDGRGDLDIFG